MTHRPFSLGCLLILGLSSPQLLAHGFVPPPVVRFTRPTSLAPGRITPANFGRATPTARSVTELRRAAAAMAIPWRAAFPVELRQNYAEGSSVDAGLNHGPEEGGWARELGRPSLLVLYDATNEEHRRALLQLEQDPRVLVGANLFNCFRADCATFGEPTDLIRLRTYDRAGNFVAEAAGGRRIRGAFDAMEKAWSGADVRSLVKILPSAGALLDAVSQTEDELRCCEEVVVCPDCGDERHDARSAVAALRLRSDQLRRDLADLR